MAGMHDGHRDRLRETFLKNGLDNFHPHNVLELLLFYSVPRKDTNSLAHTLISEFGSIDRVFDADVEQLLRVKGITYNSAVLIKLIPQISRYYMTRKAEHGECLNKVDRVGRYFVSKFVGEIHEVLYVMFLDNKMQIVTCKKLAEGTVDSVEMRIDRIIKLAANIEAGNVIIAHNHPDGSPNPSPEDIMLTVKLRDALKLIKKDLIDHIIVGDNDYISLDESGILKLGN